MTLITYKPSVEKENYKEIKNIKEINYIISKETKQILIDYRLKNKIYDIFDWKPETIPMEYIVIIKEE